MKPKYALLEIERRWLVGNMPHGDNATPVLITDKYIRGTRLRLRRMDTPDGTPIFKFCKKYGDRRGAAEPITNLYLTPDEHALLDRLPGIEVTKRRIRLSTGAIDIYSHADEELYIFEVEFENEQAAGTFVPPDFAGREITEDDAHSGLALAQRFGR